MQQHGRLFFTLTGLPHKGSLSYHFKRTLHKLGMHRAMDIAPQVLRHIIIDERSCAKPVAGPSDRDASLVMGNSEKAWVASYQLSRWDGRAAQRAADEMQSWRAAISCSCQNLCHIGIYENFLISQACKLKLWSGSACDVFALCLQLRLKAPSLELCTGMPFPPQATTHGHAQSSNMCTAFQESMVALDPVDPFELDSLELICSIGSALKVSRRGCL